MADKYVGYLSEEYNKDEKEKTEYESQSQYNEAQPAPIETDRSKEIYPDLKKDLKKLAKKIKMEEEKCAEIMVFIDDRVEEGKAHYGTTLKTHNGRDARIDALQEIADFLFYVKQLQMEGKLDVNSYEKIMRKELYVIRELTE